LVAHVTDGRAAWPLLPRVEGGGDVVGGNGGGGRGFGRQARAAAVGHDAEHVARLTDGHGGEFAVPAGGPGGCGGVDVGDDGFGEGGRVVVGGEGGGGGAGGGDERKEEEEAGVVHAAAAVVIAAVQVIAPRFFDQQRASACAARS